MRHYWHILMERRWLALATFLSCVVISVIYAYKSPSIYQATVQIEINREAENVLNMKEILSLGGQEQDYLQTQYKILQSRTLIDAVIATNHLERDSRYAGAKDTFRAVLGDYTITPIRLSRLVNIRAEHTDPKVAQIMANSLAEVYIKQNLDQKLQKTVDALNWLQTESSNLEKDVLRDQKALQAWKEKINVVTMDASKESLAQQTLRSAQTEEDKARAQAAADADTAKEVEKMVKEGKPKDSIPKIASNELISGLKQKIAEKKGFLADLRTRYKEKHPDVIKAVEELKSFEASLATNTEQIYQSILEAAKISAIVADTARRDREARLKENQLLANDLITLEDLERKARQSDLLYNNVLTRMKETAVAEKIKTNNIRVVDLATLPTSPAKPKKSLVYFFGFFGGLLAAISLAFVANYLDNAIKGQEDVENVLGLPFLGYVPHIKTNNPVERDLEAHLHPTSSSSEGFRTIRASVSLTNLPEKLRSIVVTSTAPSEGKSLVASNYAIVTAQAGLRTLLVEADLRRPSVHKTFQMHSPVGMAAYLQNRVNSVDEIIHKTEIKDLDVVCCGAIPSNPSELISSARMIEFIREATRRYDRVVLDCPPISAVSDPLIVATKADGLIFVSKFNKIRREYAHKTVRRVQEAGIHVLGAVINNIDFEGRDSYYYSQYYYQNRYYSSHYKTETEEAGKSEKKEKTSSK